MTTELKRRSFLTQTAIAGTMLAAPAVHAQRRGAQFKTCTIGSGWWGMNITREAIHSGECKIAAICDVDQTHLDGAAKEIEEMTGTKPKIYKDFRELLSKENPEIVINGTPDHWHPLITIAAVEKGAHVYVEKPISHTLKEGRAMVNAARANNRMVQVGTHRRVAHHNTSGMDFLQSGKVGQIGMVRAFVHYGGGPGEPTPDSEIPAGLDWDMWCGPAPYRPYNTTIHPKGFRRHLDYANGQIGDWGIHWLDQILWWTEETYPKTVFSHGGRPIKRDSTDAPDHQIAVFEFEEFTAYWEHRFFGANESEKTNIGCYFYGTNGIFHIGWIDGWTFYPSNTSQNIVHEDAKFENTDRHNIKELFADFLASIHSGGKRLPVCDIEIGHRSTSLSLLAMLSLKHGKSIEWDGQREVCIGDEDANRLLTRQYRAPWQYPSV